ncbi:MAG: threonine transporter [Bacteroidetes bacterium]|nr:threonine transporter [Bacteroidota bacterium]
MEQKIDLKHPFNGPIECGLRSLVILEHVYPGELDLQRLVFYDYLLIHSGDANGPESIHPATPHRSGEVLVKRHILEQGALLMISRNLIKRNYSTTGIAYQATENATPFLDNLTSKYTVLLKERAIWVLNEFQKYSDSELEHFFKTHLDRWGGEFDKQAILKHEIA